MKKTKSKKEKRIIIHNENKIVLHSNSIKKRKRKYKKRTQNKKGVNMGYPTQASTPIVINNQVPERKETLGELNNLALNYNTPTPRLSLENVLPQKNDSELVTSTRNPSRKPTFRLLKSVTSQLKFSDPDDKASLKRMGIKQLKDYMKKNNPEIPLDKLKLVTAKTKNEAINDYIVYRQQPKKQNQVSDSDDENDDNNSINRSFTSQVPKSGGQFVKPKDSSSFDNSSSFSLKSPIHSIYAQARAQLTPITPNRVLNIDDDDSKLNNKKVNIHIASEHPLLTQIAGNSPDIMSGPRLNDNLSTLSHPIGFGSGVPKSPAVPKNSVGRPKRK